MSKPQDTSQRAVELTRTATGHYTARNCDGAEIAFGQGEGLLSPVELLLAAIAGCSAIDVDTVTSRNSTPTQFTVRATGNKVTDEDGGNLVTDLNLSFHLAFPDDAGGQIAAKKVERVVALSHDKYCTVSRTVERGTPVSHRVDVQVGDTGGH